MSRYNFVRLIVLALSLQVLLVCPAAAVDFNFDAVTAPALPDGWVTSHSGAGKAWTTTTTNADTPPNAAFVDNTNDVSDKSLDSPAFKVGASRRVTFRHSVNLQYQDDPLEATRGYDGAVLEISIDGAAFVDVIAAGGKFESGQYNTTIDKGFGSALKGRQAWSGDSNGYQNVSLILPAAAKGKSVKLRWRVATDAADPMGFKGGYWLGRVHVDP